MRVAALLLLLLDSAHAPRALPTYRFLALNDGPSHPQSSADASTAAAMGIAATATAMAAAAALRKITSIKPDSVPPYIHFGNQANSSSADNSRRSNGYYPKGKGRPPPRIECVDCNDVEVQSEEGDHAWSDESEGDEGAVAAEQDTGSTGGAGAGKVEGSNGTNSAAGSTSGRRSRPKGLGKLWTKAQFPEKDCCDLRNLIAAQAWQCPCKDRANCIGRDRIPDVLQLYEYRKTFQTTAGGEGGFRDATRKEMESHYSSATREFSRSFVVGPLNDCCIASAGLAKGLAFGTFARARVDTRKQQVWRDGRRAKKERQESKEIAYIEAYIREEASGMEGAKGRETAGVWHTMKMPVKKRWEKYRDSRIRAKLPVVGSQSLFEKVWRKHTEIREYGAKNHAKCDVCGALEVEMDALRRRVDAHAISLREDIAMRKVRSRATVQHLVSFGIPLSVTVYLAR